MKVKPMIFNTDMALALHEDLKEPDAAANYHARWLGIKKRRHLQNYR